MTKMHAALASRLYLVSADDTPATSVTITRSQLIASGARRPQVAHFRGQLIAHVSYLSFGHVA